jgi:hypothetical protein
MRLFMDSRVSHLAKLFTPITEEQRAEVNYTAYYDEPLKEKASKGFRLAAQEVSYVDLKSALVVMYGHAKKFSEYLNSKEFENLTPIKVHIKIVESKFEPFMAQEKIDANAVFVLLFEKGDTKKSLFNWFNEMVVTYSEYEHLPTRFAFQRYGAAFRGLAMNAALQTTREKLMAKFLGDAATAKEQVPHPITERKIKIPAGKRDALVAVSEMERAQALPLALATLQAMLAVVADNAERQPTRDALLSAKQILSDMRDRFEKPYAEQVEEYTAKQEAVLVSLAKLVQDMKAIQPKEDIQKLGLELSTYLCGFYLFDHSKKSLPAYVRYKQEDEQLQKATQGKLSKMIVAQCFEEASLALGNLFKNPALVANSVHIDMLAFKKAPEENPEALLNHQPQIVAVKGSQ